MQAVSTITQIDFPKVKIGFDCSMVVISAVTCLIAIHSFGSVGIGTMIAAVLVGVVLGKLNYWFGTWRDRLLEKDRHEVQSRLAEELKREEELKTTEKF